MKKVKFGTIAAAGVVTALLVGAVALGLRERAEKDVNEASLPSADPVMAVSYENYFARFRAERDSTRALELTYLDEVISAAANDEETLADAQRQKLALVENMELELVIENLIVSRGFSDAAVTIHNGNINVVVDSAELTNEDVAVILDIVRTESGSEAADIRISGIQ